MCAHVCSACFSFTANVRFCFFSRRQMDENERCFKLFELSGDLGSRFAYCQNSDLEGSKIGTKTVDR